MLKRLTTLMILAASSASADPIEGIWKTQPGDEGNFGHVQIAMCEDLICGTLIRAFDGEGEEIDSDNIGKNLVWAMKIQGNGRYRGGKIWAPDRDKTYKSKMLLDGDVLSVSGCVLVICRDQTWTRVE